VFALVKENLSGAKRRRLPLAGKVLLGQGEWPVALQDTPDRDWKE